MDPLYFVVFLSLLAPFGDTDRVCPAVVALVPARAGSKGIKRKNLSLIGNETLLGRTLRTIHEAGLFSEVWVSTDGEEIAQEAEVHGADVHWRNPSTAVDSAATISAVTDFVQFHNDISAIAVIQCTSPFLKAEFLSSAYCLMISKNLDCVFSATRVHHLRWTGSQDRFVTPLNFDPKKRPRRQDWNGELIENGMFYFAKTRLITEDKTLQNTRCGVFEVPKKYSLEIDTKSDLMMARAMYELIKAKIIT